MESPSLFLLSIQRCSLPPRAIVKFLLSFSTPATSLDAIIFQETQKTALVLRALCQNKRGVTYPLKVVGRTQRLYL